MKTVEFIYNNYNSIKEALKAFSPSDYQDLLVHIYTTKCCKEYIKDLQIELKKALGSPKIIGIAASKTFCNSSDLGEETVVSVTFFKHSRVSTALITDTQQPPLEILDSTSFAFVLSNDSGTNSRDLLRKLWQKESVVVAGGEFAKSAQNKGFVFHQEGIAEQGVVCACVHSSCLHIATHSLFSWRALGKEMVVTKADGNSLLEVDNRDVLTLYKQHFKQIDTTEILNIAQKFPLVLKRDKKLVARAPLEVTKNRGLLYPLDIQIGDRVQFGFGDIAQMEQELLETKRDLMSQQFESLFLFSSTYRREYLERDYQIELATFNALAPIAGALGSGVFDSHKSCSMTTSIVALSEADSSMQQKEISSELAVFAHHTTEKYLANLYETATQDLIDELFRLNQFRKAIEETTIYSITDTKGVITFANKNFAQLSEYSQEELVGKPHNIVRHPDMPKEAFRDLWETIKQGIPWRGTVKNRKKYGGYYYVNAYIFPIFGRDGECEEYVSFRDDITEQEERRSRLEGEIRVAQKSKESSLALLSQYENIIDTNSAIVRFDRDNTITYVNRGFCEIHGCKELGVQSLIGKKIAEIYDSRYFKKSAQKIYRKILRKKIWTGLTKNISMQGEIYYAETTISPILDVDGKLVEHMIISHDVTDLITAQKEIEETQKDIVFKMGAIGEVRSKETGNHVKRVAEYSYLIAKALGFSEQEANLLKIASPMHDIGKVGISDTILNKPARLSEEEFEVMKTHAEMGYEMLKGSKREILQAAAIVAREHHERYDGKGYPRGLRGKEIHIYGRITAIADVFDALSTKRVYKDPWDLEAIRNLIQEERGRQFDPNVSDVFLENFEKIVDIMKKHGD